MKSIYLLLFSMIFSNAFSQEIQEREIKTKVNEVTVFLDGAQVTRKERVNFSKGNTIIKFVNLSPFIDAKSIQIKTASELTVLSVNHQINHLDKAEKSTELINLEKQFDVISDKLKLENTHLSIINDELVFLQENRNIGGKSEQVNVSNLKQASDFYSEKLTSLRMKEIEKTKIINTLNNQLNDLRNQIKTLSNKKDYSTGEILVKFDAKQTGSYDLEISYLVGNVSWFPSYDIRATNINEPIQLIYKANVKQDTKVDWSNVKLKLSSGNPNASGVAPKLQTYLLNYNIAPPTYRMHGNNVSGKVIDNYGEALPGVSVLVEGTTIGTITDANGNYSITIPNSSSKLKYLYIGFDDKILPITGSVMNVSLEKQNMLIEEVLVVGYGATKDKIRMEERLKTANMEAKGLIVPTTQIENQTTVDFEIKIPYSIKSDNKSYTVDVDTYQLPALYQYYSVPKVDKDAFLIASIIDWEKYNLLEGEANVFFENTYIGKTLMNVKYASDTLELSLGRDKNVSISREKTKSLVGKQIVGNKKEETREWTTTIKNNKSQSINMAILDQVPISTSTEIEVNVQGTSGGKQNLETGEIKWEFELKPNSKKELKLKYSVKYPKGKNLIVE